MPFPIAYFAVLSILPFAIITGATLSPSEPVEIECCSSPRLQLNPLRCPCSPSGRGFLQAQVDLLMQGIVNAGNAYKEAGAKGQSEDKKRKAMFSALQRALAKCISKFDFEACVNADASLRKRLPVQYCTYDKITGKNMHFKNQDPKSNAMQSVQSCSTDKAFESTREQLGLPALPPPEATAEPSQSPSLESLENVLPSESSSPEPTELT